MGPPKNKIFDGMPTKRTRRDLRKALKRKKKSKRGRGSKRGGGERVLTLPRIESTKTVIQAADRRVDGLDSPFGFLLADRRVGGLNPPFGLLLAETALEMAKRKRRIEMK